MTDGPTYDERLARARTAGVVVSYWGLPDVLMAQLAGHLGEAVPLVSERDAYRIAEAGAMWLAICPVYGDDVEIIRRVPDGPDIDAQCNIVREIGRRTVTVPSVHPEHAGNPARHLHPQWARDVRDQCAAVGVPYFFKQCGDWTAIEPDVWQNRRETDHDVREDGYHWPLSQPHGAEDGSEVVMRRVGKRTAGRELDGRTHDEYPVQAAS